MIPIKLTLRGFYSYRTIQTIHFDKLTEAHIFGIFGPTGCGKSTIPEAISFVLYGDTERLNQKESRAYNMMNLQSDELLVDFVFMAGKTSQKYRATASAKRNSRNFNEVRTIDRKAWQWNGIDWVPIETTALVDIIGLTYSNFKRTTIIPQGKFQEFLQLGDTERIKMMQELFGLEKFDLQFKAASVLKKANELRITLQTQVNELQGNDEENLNQLIEQIQQKNAMLAEVTVKLNEYQLLEKKLIQNKEVYLTYVEARQELEKVLAETNEVTSLEIQLMEFLYCQANFQPLLVKTNELNAQLTELNNSLSKLYNNEAKLNDQLNAELAELTALEPKVAAIPTDTEKAKHLRLASQWLAATKLLKEVNDRANKGLEYIYTTETQLKTLLETRRILQGQLDEKQALMPNVQLLERIQQWWMQHDYLAERQAEALQNRTMYETSLLNIEEKVVGQKAIFELLDAATAIEPTLVWQQLEAKLIAQRKAFELVEDELQPLSISVKLADFASDLASGEPCPLCGSTHHPNKYDPPQVRERIKELNAQKKQILHSITELEKWRDYCKNAANELQLKHELLETTKQKLELHIHETKAHWNSYPKDSNLPQERAAFIEAQKQLDELRITCESLRKQLDKTLTEQDQLHVMQDKARLKMQTIANELEQHKVNVGALEQQIKPEVLAETLQNGETWALATAVNLEGKAEEANTRYQKLKMAIENKRLDLAREQAQISYQNERYSQLENDLNETKQNLEKAILASSVGSTDQVIKILASSLDTKQAIERINSYKIEKSRLTELVDKLEQSVAENPFDEDAYDQLCNKTQELDKQKNELISGLAVVKQQQADVMQKMERCKQLEVELRKAECRIERLEVLQNLFKAKGFVNYVSSVYMQNLVNAANERFFKLTGHKLRLELTPKNDFEVRDFMNNGQTRHVKTLSGGQTFQASLSLALALADSIHYQRQTKENFFFLDEGFGSLDRESLQMVFETLKSLRAENRIVGIISHVEELQQEIDAYIKITNTPESGSVVVSSVGH